MKTIAPALRHFAYPFPSLPADHITYSLLKIGEKSNPFLDALPPSLFFSLPIALQAHEYQ